MVKFEGCKLELSLEAQMPMLHFQSNQCGATLRASEVKPKLDTFILAGLMRETGKNLDGLKKDEAYKTMFLDAKTNDALDYKLQITVTETPVEIDINKKEENYSIFYANMGKKDPNEKIYGLFSNPKVTVVCFKENLRKQIAQNIEKFFLVTNFGTMQNKGFGSFAPSGWGGAGKLRENDMKQIAAYYGEIIENCHCYAMVFDSANCVQMSEAIKTYYSIMKSGQNRGAGNYARSYIYQYMHNKYQMGNEKAWMKKQQIAPALSKPENEKVHLWVEDHPHYYVRAFLGIGEKIEFGSAYNEKGFVSNKKKVAMKSKKFDRISSPIYFKVIKNVVFIVGFEVPEELYGAVFTFSGEWQKKSGELSVPRKDLLNGQKFDMQDFLDEYAKYFNGELRREVRINKIPKVVRVHA